MGEQVSKPANMMQTDELIIPISMPDVIEHYWEIAEQCTAEKWGIA